MGKIKKTILRKQDRAMVEPRPPSMRRVKRMNKSSNDSAKAGRNSTLTTSRIVSLRGLRRLVKGNVDPSGTFAQVMPRTVVFRFKKKHRPTVDVTHRHYSDERKDETSTKRINVMTCPADDSERIARFKLMEKEGLGKIETNSWKVIRHRVDEQDGNFKFHNHDVKF